MRTGWLINGSLWVGCMTTVWPVGPWNALKTPSRYQTVLILSDGVNEQRRRRKQAVYVRVSVWCLVCELRVWAKASWAHNEISTSQWVCVHSNLFLEMWPRLLKITLEFVNETCFMTLRLRKESFLIRDTWKKLFEDFSCPCLAIWRSHFASILSDRWP